MHGNVWEWCADDWHDSYEEAPKVSQIWAKDIKNHEDDETKKLLRGGSWFSNDRYCRSAHRYSFNARIQDDNYGFRVVCVVR
ncbi:MAG: serine/threonine protein kinase [Pseudanabaena frigida]|uniref:Serine/threonine protein kinase n=1 Tax=Pseudanabaena frigida TaxID=945775 RepID=A0A2W4W1J2_9CYAN|nr:MAG: serine/threonine protein kinase [Pseudanabaena frigida]